jgi:hypothetical protein
MCRLTVMLRATDRLVRALLVPSLVFIATSVDRNYQTDLWHHLARGKVLVEEGTLLNYDRFTYTIGGQPLQDANWAWQAAFYCLYRAGGLPLVQTINSAILALAFGLLFALTARRCDSPAVACAACVAAFLGLWPLMIIRPQSVSLLLFVVQMIALDRANEDRRWLLLPPLVVAIWANVHGGFAIGVYLVAADTAARAVETIARQRPLPGALVRQCGPWFLCVIACPVATLANPYGWRVYEYVVLTSSRATSRHIDEWLPPGLDSLTGKVFAISVGAIIVLGAVPRRRLSLRDAIVLGCLLLPALASVRMVAWWLLVWTPVVAISLVRAWPRLRLLDADDRRVSRSAAGVVAGLLAVAILSTPWFERINPVFRLPGRGHRTEEDLQAAADFLTEQGARRIFTRFAWGEYLGWSLAPRATVFMDGRIDIFADDIWGQYAAITRGRSDWEEILAGYDVDCLVLDASGYDGQLLSFVEKSPRWREALKKGSAVVFLRESSGKTTSSQARRGITSPGAAD